MDLNKKHLRYFLIPFLFLGLNASGQAIALAGRVFDQRTKAPVESAGVVLFTRDSLFLKGTTSDSTGTFGFANLSPGEYLLSVSSMGFEPQRILLQNFCESAEIAVFLDERVWVLGDVSVTASSRADKMSRRIVFPTGLQRSHSANGMQLLNAVMLPGLYVNPMSNTIASSDGGKVVLQINGVNAAPEEIQALQPRRIKRIEYTDYAGIRYGEASKIVNYIVAGDEKGGVLGVDLMNSLDILAGGDVFFARFNAGRSEYALHYTTAFQKISSNNRTRTGSYQLGDSVLLRREEIGDGGDYSYRMHDVIFGYNYQPADSVFFNAKLKYALTDHPKNDFKSDLKEDGAARGRVVDGVSQKINAPAIDLYYEHGLKNRQKVYVNLVGSYAEAETHRKYAEYAGVDTLFRERFDQFSDKYTWIAEGIYEKRFIYAGLKVGAKHIQSFSKQKICQNGVFRSDMNRAETAVFAEWSYSKAGFSCSAGLKVNRAYFSNAAMRKSYHHVLPAWMFGWRLSGNSFIRYDAEISQTNPTLLELTDIEVRLDPYLSESGNASLKPYWNTNNHLCYENKGEVFTFNANLRHHYKRRPIMESVKKQGDVFLIRPENMRHWNRYNAEMAFRAGMAKSSLQFSLTGGYSYFNSRGKSYSHSHAYWYLHAQVLAMYKKWMFIGQIQPSDEKLYGETVTKSGNYHYLALQYNADNFSFGVGAFNPCKNVSRTILENKNRQVPFRRESFSDASQTVVLTLTWNFSFGKMRAFGSKSIEN